MKWKAVFAVALTAWVVGCGAKDATPRAGNGDGDGDNAPPTATVHFIGRFDTRNTGEARHDWPATSIYATFDGTGISARIDGSDNYFEVFIDGARSSTVHFVPASGGGSTAQTLTLASGLSNGRHTVQLFRRTESFNFPTSFMGFTVTGGALVATPYPFQRRIEVIGDSITAGYGIDAPNSACTYTQATQDPTDTYIAITARNLEAALSMVAYSGKGMYRDLDFDMTAPMPKLYDRTLFNDSALTWDATAYVPDVIVINLGTNDYGNGNPGQPFIDTYIDFLERLRGLYPQAEIFCAAGGMQSSDVYLAAVQAAVTGSSDDRVHFVRFAALQQADWICDAHPNKAWNAAQAVTLTAAIKTEMGW